MPGLLLDVGSLTIDGRPYRMVRTDTARAWERTYLDEPPWSSGPPATLSAPTQTWHSGAFHSRASIQPVTEYGKNTDCRFPYRMMPAAQINVLALPGCLSTPTSLFEALGQLWVVAARYVFRVDTANNVVMSKDFDSVQALMGLRWEQDYGLVTTKELNASLWKVTAIGSPDSWAQTTNVPAYRLANGVDRLYKVSKDGFLKNIASGLDPMVESNWADNVQCGRTDIPATSLVAYARTVFVGTPEALYGVDETGVTRPLVSRMIRDNENCLGMESVDPWVYVPHARGLYRMVPGRVSSVGLEQEDLNESPVRGRIRAISTDGRWVLASLWTGTDTYILVARDAEEADASLGPLVWDTWLYLPGKPCDVLYVSSFTSPPRLWFGYGTDLAYVELTTGAGTPDPLGSGYKFATSGQRWLPRYNFGDWGPKAFTKIAAVGRRVTGSCYWTISYSIDGGAYQNVDTAGRVMKVEEEGLTVFILPATAVGREIQLRLDYYGDSPDNFAELIYVEPFATPISRQLPEIIVQLLLAPVLHDRSVEYRSSIDQMNDLQSLLGRESPVDIEAPWGVGKGWVKRIKIVEATQEGDREPELVVSLLLQERVDA